MHIHRFALLSAVLLATLALGQGSSRSAPADFINQQNDKIGTAVLTQTSGGVKIDVDIAHLAHPVNVDVTLREGFYRGSTTLKQTRFGITPVSIAGGTVKVKDEMKVEFEIALVK